MIKSREIIGLLVIVILTLLLFRNCDNTTPVEPVNAETKINFKTPTYKNTIDTFYVDSIVYITKLVPTENDSLLKKYLELKDSIKKLEMYKEAIAIREYKQTYKDSTQKVEVYSKTRGELITQTLSYEIYPKTYTIDTNIVINAPIVPQKYLNLGVGYNFSTQVPVLHTSFIYINKRNRLHEIGLSSNMQIYLKYGVRF